jgi:hypothetical protein
MAFVLYRLLVVRLSVIADIPQGMCVAYALFENFYPVIIEFRKVCIRQWPLRHCCPRRHYEMVLWSNVGLVSVTF